MSIAWVFDTETTGLAGELIQAGWIEFLDNRLAITVHNRLISHYLNANPNKIAALIT